MAMIAKLDLDESVWMDPDKLTELTVQVGESGAEEIITRTLDALVSQLETIRADWHERGYSSLRKDVHDIAELSSYVGLSSLARVALDVDYCLSLDDSTAVTATMFRLFRVGERSLIAVDEMRGATM